MKKFRRIYLDMDGVCVDFAEGVARQFDTTVEVLNSKWTPGQYSIHVPLGLDSEDILWEKVTTEEFWTSLKPFPWADELWNLAAEFAEESPIILSTPTKNPTSVAGKLRWLQTWKGPRFRDYIFTQHKHLLATGSSLLIDDRVLMCSRFAKAGGNAILFPQIWNPLHRFRECPIEYIRRVLVNEEWEDWSDVEEIRG